MDRTPAGRPDLQGSGDRFNEEKATYALRGADAPDLEAGIRAIRNVLKTLPVRPGVYRMQDAKGEVLYVGKARALKNRVTNYTQVAKLPKRLQRMVAQTRDMTKREHWGTGGSGKPVGTAEISKVLKQSIGMVSLAHAGDATTVDSQIFIVIGPASHTEGKYPIFGKVITGLDVVRKLAVEDRIIRATVKGAT